MRRLGLLLGLLGLVGIGWWAATRMVRAQPGQVLIAGGAGDYRATDSAVWLLPGTEVCELPATPSGHGRFSAELRPVDRSGASWPLHLEVEVTPPRQADTSWPAGSFCAALEQRLAAAASRWVAESSAEHLRGLAPSAIGEHWRRELSSWGIEVGSIAAELTLPGGAVVESVPELVAARRPGLPPVWLIGLDGADWQLLDQLIAEGVMPELGRLVAEGSSGVLRSESPPLSPLLWTTMVTGVSPLEHGILDFTRFRASDGVKEPISAAERQVPALWNMASWAGIPVVQLGLWATFPAEPIKGLVVSDRFFGFLFNEQSPPAGAVSPASRDRWARDHLAAVETEVGEAEVRAYLPWLSSSEYQRRVRAQNAYDDPVAALRRILVETRVYDRLFRSALEELDPGLAMLYLQGTDTIGHTFAAYAPPRLPHIAPADFERYSDVPRRYFAEVDLLLGSYRKLASERRALMILVSDHGFLWSSGRPDDLSSTATATAAKWHRDEGIYLVWGPEIPNDRRREASAAPGLRSVAASVLAWLGLPAGQGMAPGGLPGAAEGGARVDYRQWYRAMAASEGGGVAVAGEELAELRALGYLGSGESTSRPAQAGSSPHTGGWYNNQGLVLRQEGRAAEARTAFEKALELDPNLASAAWNASDLLFAEGDFDRSDALLLQAFGLGLARGPEFVVGRAIGYQRAGDPARSLRLVEAAVTRDPSHPDVWLFLGRYRTEAGDCAGAADAFQRALAIDTNAAPAWASLGVARMCLGDQAGAIAALRRSLELDPNQPRIRSMLEGG